MLCIYGDGWILSETTGKKPSGGILVDIHHIPPSPHPQLALIGSNWKTKIYQMVADSQLKLNGHKAGLVLWEPFCVPGPERGEVGGGDQTCGSSLG